MHVLVHQNQLQVHLPIKKYQLPNYIIQLLQIRKGIDSKINYEINESILYFRGDVKLQKTFFLRNIRIRRVIGSTILVAIANF
jgi:hypothetical protein